MKIGASHLLAGLGIMALAFTFACGGGGSSSSVTPPPSTTGNVQAIVSDDPTEDWATIGVKVLSISLVPQGGGTPVPIYTAPSPAPMINLVQLDQLGEIIGNVNNIQAGTYTAAKLTLGANNDGTNCDVTLTASGDPESGFDVAAGATVPCSQIQIMGAQGTAPNMTVGLTVNLTTPLTVTANSSNALDLEFDLRHPALIVEHDAAGAAAPYWAVNFNGPVRHRPHPDLTKLILRHMYGQVASVSSDNTSITIDRVFPVHPITNPETATVSTIAVPILADATNGTLFYNLDGSSDAPQTIDNFQSLATTLPNMYVRIAARYQENGTLTATRIFASSSFDKVWKNPEGHVLHVNTANNTMWVTTEDGKATHIAIGPNTNFYFGSSNNQIGAGTAFFDGTTPGGLPNIARGFKVNITTDPLAATTPPTALTVEIDVARYDGSITSPTQTGFNYTRNFVMADARGGKDNYTGTLDYISSTSTNYDQQGNQIQGFYWWDFAFPTKADTGTNAVTDFVNATDGSVNFGGGLPPMKVVGLSNATWNDSAAPNTWAAKWTVLEPTGAPLGLISTPFSSASNSFFFTAPIPALVLQTSQAQSPVQVYLSTSSGSATLVYQIDRQNGVITVTPQDISNQTTLQTVAANLTTNVPVKVYGIPNSDGTNSIKAYVLLYYTHTTSAK